MIARATRPIHWDVYEEHLEEAAFLWGQWEDALVAANYTLMEVTAGPEARLLAHLDGLVLGGARIAEELLRPVLAHSEAGRVASAAWCLVQAEHGGDYQDDVLAAMTRGDERTHSAIARALGLAPRADLERVARLWPGATPEIRAALLGGIGPRRPEWARPRLEEALRSGFPSLVTAALRVLRSESEPHHFGLVEGALRDSSPEVRCEAIAAGMTFRSEAAWSACREAAATPGDACRLPLGLLATSRHPHDRAFVRATLSDAEVKRHAIWALGFVGDREAADVLVEATEDPSIARVAGESLCAITGLTLGRSMVRPGTSIGPDVREVGEDDPPPVVRNEDHLPMPDATVIKRWWRHERSRLGPGVMLLHGGPRTPEAVHAALATATMWRREVLWLDLAGSTGRPPAVDLFAWTTDQRRQWRQGQAPEPMS